MEPAGAWREADAGLCLDLDQVAVEVNPTAPSMLVLTLRLVRAKATIR